MNLPQEDWVTQKQADKMLSYWMFATEDEYNEGIIENAINIDIHKDQYS
jgi:hypothetical protein